MTRPRFVAITGTTASGKTDLSLALAEALDVEIISMDSRQVYAGMDIGTDKVRGTARYAVPHHGLDLVQADERYSAGQFARDVREWIAGIESRGRLPLLVGGTGFFLRAVLRPLFSEPEMDESRRRRLRKWLTTLDTEELGRWARRLDPDRAEKAIEGGAQRISRTVEVPLLTGRSLSWWHDKAPEDGPGLPGVVLVLDLPRERTVASIDARVDSMIGRGLVDEVKGLIEAGYRDADPGMSGTGYREIARFLRGETSLEDAKDEIRMNTRRYARRQVTWFRHQLPEDAVRIDATRPLAEQVEIARNAMIDGGLSLDTYAKADLSR